MNAARYEFCEGGSIGEHKRLIAANPELKGLWETLCGDKGTP